MPSRNLCPCKDSWSGRDSPLFGTQLSFPDTAGRPVKGALGSMKVLSPRRPEPHLSESGVGGLQRDPLFPERFNV